MNATYNKCFLMLLLLSVILLLGCSDLPNPDDGLKFKLELKDISKSQLRHFNYSELDKNSGCYIRGYHDTIIAYEYDQGTFVRRHALFKIKKTLATIDAKEFFRKIGFVIKKTPPESVGGTFLVQDIKYKKQYYVLQSKQQSLEFSYPDTLVVNN